ncbi:hypothetical protein [Prosthecodimorpha staleyi]|uniref:SPOR domain-containing protein n=1 Tax=Prosthecodimorpha staleyi TaxID=2840188 RepID=A0A947GF10_9HYPH|nr:hypothetical protein [Prosthecodimorpha staleyi]MBT9292607.1 hypothetical protein [Prosthecodimorpha staleyi]
MAALLQDPLKQIEAERAYAATSVFTLAAWGFVAVMAVLTGFAAWQYAPQRPATASRQDGPENTGTIGTPVNPQFHGRTRPSAGGGGDPIALAGEVEMLRQEVLDLRRLVGRADQKFDLLSQRVTLLEDQATILTAGLTSVARRPVPDAARAPEGAAAAPATSDIRPDPSRPPAPGRHPASDPGLTRVDPRPGDIKPGEFRPSLPAGPSAATLPASGGPPASGNGASTAAPTPVPALPPAPQGQGGAPQAALPAPAAPSASAAPGRITANPSITIGVRSDQAPDPGGRAPETTGTVPTVAPGRGDYGVDLGGYRSLVQLRKAWLDIDARLPKLTKGYHPLAQARETGDGIEVRLVGGPFPSPAEALKYCIAAKGAGLACTPASYVGQPPGK